MKVYSPSQTAEWMRQAAGFIVGDMSPRKFKQAKTALKAWRAR